MTYASEKMTQDFQSDKGGIFPQVLKGAAWLLSFVPTLSKDTAPIAKAPSAQALAPALLEGASVAIVGRSRKTVRALRKQIRHMGGSEIVFSTPEAYLSAVANNGLQVNSCLMVQDDFSRRHYSVADVAGASKQMQPKTSVFGLSSIIERNDVAKRKNEVIDGLMRLPLNPSVMAEAFA